MILGISSNFLNNSEKFMNKTEVLKSRSRKISGKTAARLAAGGFAAGVINGIFGNGGGVLVVFLLGYACEKMISDGREIFSNVTAAVLPMALTSALIYSSYAPPSLADALSVGAASLAGGILGACLLGRISADMLKKIFAAVMIISGGIMLFLR